MHTKLNRIFRLFAVEIKQDSVKVKQFPKVIVNTDLTTSLNNKHE